MFDFSGVEASGFSVLPAGWYNVTVTDAYFQETKAGNGEYLKVEFTTDKDRKIFDMFNVVNPNPKAVNIGLAQLKSLLIACTGNKDINKLGKPEILETITNQMLSIKLKIKNDPNYGEQNNVVDYKKIDGVQKQAEEDVPF